MSYLIMCFGISLMANSKISLLVVDKFLNNLVTHFHESYRRLKTIFDVPCLSLSVMFSYLFIGELTGVGMVTIIMAFITGADVHFANGLLGKMVVIHSWSKTLENMAL